MLQVEFLHEATSSLCLTRLVAINGSRFGSWVLRCPKDSNMLWQNEFINYHKFCFITTCSPCSSLQFPSFGRKHERNTARHSGIAFWPSFLWRPVVCCQVYHGSLGRHAWPAENSQFGSAGPWWSQVPSVQQLLLDSTIAAWICLNLLNKDTKHFSHTTFSPGLLSQNLLQRPRPPKSHVLSLTNFISPCMKHHLMESAVPSSRSWTSLAFIVFMAFIAFIAWVVPECSRDILIILLQVKPTYGFRGDCVATCCNIKRFSEETWVSGHCHCAQPRVAPDFLGRRPTRLRQHIQISSMFCHNALQRHPSAKSWETTNT